MKRTIILSAILFGSMLTEAQVSPAISAWIQNTTGVKGRHYVSGNSTPITDSDSANVQTVLYSATSVYVRTKGVPSYVTGPFLDGNPSLTTSQNAIFKFPLSPVQNTVTPTATNGGNIGVFINGVALFDYRDGKSYALGSATISAMGDGIWNRDAVVAEKGGFDCSKGHPAMGNYHHHQNPSAFKLDINVISTVCNLYDADGLYAINSTQHSPLIGFAYDGFPIYGAYGYKNADGTGGIVRIQSSYSKRSISVRTHYADGTDVTDGPAVNVTYPLGYFREDYEYIAPSGSQPEYLDAHNGRFCVTPEYPTGTYAYFCTVDANWNSSYPYAVGPTFYGVKSAAKVSSISESTTTYTSAAVGIKENKAESFNVTIFPNPANDFIAVQLGHLNKENTEIMLYDVTGKFIQKAVIYQGSTIAYIDTKTLYNGEYLIKVISDDQVLTRTIILSK